MSIVAKSRNHSGSGNLSFDWKAKPRKTGGKDANKISEMVFEAAFDSWSELLKRQKSGSNE